MQQQQQLYQRMAGGMYNGPHGLTLVQGSNMGPRMVYNPVSGQTIMTTQHSGGMMSAPQAGAGNNVLPSRSGMIGPGSSMIPGMGPAPPNMSAANMVQNQSAMSMPQKIMADQIMVSQAMHAGVMLNNQSVVPNQTIGSGNFPPHLPPSSMAQSALSREMQLNQMSRDLPPGALSRGPGTPNMMSPDNKNKQMLNKNPTAGVGAVMMPGNMPPPMSPATTMVSPPSAGTPQMGGSRTPQQRTPPASVSPGTTENSRDNITLNTAVAEPLPGDDAMNPT